MHLIRRLVVSNRSLALLLLALALAMKLLVPAGFMPMQAGGQLVVGLCSGTGDTTTIITIPMNSKGDADQGKQGQPCAFASLAAPLLAATDPVLLAAAVLFVIALGLWNVALPRAPAPAYLRPPLRAPPLSA